MDGTTLDAVATHEAVCYDECGWGPRRAPWHLAVKLAEEHEREWCHAVGVWILVPDL